MKKIILVVVSSLISFSLSQALAYGNPVSNIPNEVSSPDSGWSVFMTEKACKEKYSSKVTGASERLSGGDVLYTVYNSKGKVVRQAIASSYSRYAKTSCLKYVYQL